MNEETTAKPEGIYYWIALAGAVSNFFGSRACYEQITLTPEEQATMTPEIRAMQQGWLI